MNSPLPTAYLNWLEALDVDTPSLQRAYAEVSQAYRQREGSLQISSTRQAQAYALARFPATYAVVLRVLDELVARWPALNPVSSLDFGAGPGTFTLAAQHFFSDLSHFSLVESNAAMQALGQSFLEGAGRWSRAWAGQTTDLACAAYVLNELPSEARTALFRQLQEHVQGAVLLIEPGTPLGYSRILEARRFFLAQGWSILAPCPHAEACPLTADDWCHFAQRVPRSRLHRQLKHADKGHEDEKFSYLICAREAPAQDSSPAEPEARVLRHPYKHKGHLRFQLCTPEGEAQEQVVSKKNSLYKRAKRTDWGDLFPVL